MANIKSPTEILEAAGNALETAVDKAGDGVEVLVDKASGARERIDKARFGPVFDLEQISDNMPQVIYVEDNQRLKSVPACKGAIGFTERLKGLSLMRLLPENTDLAGLKLYPDTDGLLYIQDPCDDHLYIDINAYFDYLRAARISELENVARALGAQHIKIVQKEEKKYFASADAKASHPYGETAFGNTEVLADADCDAGDAPAGLELKYLQKDTALASLIQTCMDGEESVTDGTYCIVCSDLDGLHPDDAAKLDAVISALKLNGNASVTGAVEAEERSILEYTIEF